MKKKDVLKAAKHIKEEIQDQIYENDTYPASDAFLDDNDYNVPSLLNLMLSKVILPVEKNRHTDKKYKHISVAASCSNECSSTKILSITFAIIYCSNLAS